MEPISIYVHIPMCVKKCAYCDFTSYCGRMNQRDAYTEAVCREMREQAAFFGARRVNTVFFGGGTPTLMTGAQMARMMDTLRACFDLAVRGIIRLVDRQCTAHRFVISGFAKRPAQLHFRAVADKGAHFGKRAFRIAQLTQGIVRRVKQVLKRVEQCSVQIEENGVKLPHSSHLLILVRPDASFDLLRKARSRRAGRHIAQRTHID